MVKLVVFALVLLSADFSMGNGCTEMRNFWRIKYDLEAEFPQAKKGFERVFGSPFNMEFAPQLSINIDDNGYEAFSETSFNITAFDGNVNQFVTDYAATSRCATSNIAVTASIFFPGTIDLGWFAQLVRDPIDKAKTFLYIGLRYCTPRANFPNSPPVINAVCNQMLPQSMLTNLARFACILEASAIDADIPSAMATCINVVAATP